MLQYFFKILKNIISIEIDKNTNHKIFKCLNLKLKIKYTYLEDEVECFCYELLRDEYLKFWKY